MTIEINISDITQPVIKETEKSSFIKRFLVNKIESYLLRKIARMLVAIEGTILKIEGTHIHLKKLSPESAEKVLPSIKKAITTLESRYDNLQEINFFDSEELKSKYKYLLKNIYKSEAITHKIAYKSKVNLKTDESMKNGIIKMNSSFLKKTV